MVLNEIAAGDEVRRRAGVAVKASLLMVAAFAVVTIASKNVAAWNLAQPWQDDPSDVIVSLDYVVLPVLVGVAALRVQLCRHDETLPARRLGDVLKVVFAGLACSLITELAEWITVVLGLHRDVWDASTSWQVLLLAVFTALTVPLIWRVRAITRSLGRLPERPDWLGDLILLCDRIATDVPGAARTVGPVARWTDAHVLPWVRRRPVTCAWLMALVLGSPFVIAKAVLEQYPPSLLLLITAFVTASLYAIIMVSGAYLRVVAPSAEPSPWTVPSVLGSFCGSAAFAFHDHLLSQQTPIGVTALFLIGLVGGTVVTRLGRLMVSAIVTT